MVTSGQSTHSQAERMGDVLAVITSTQGYSGLQQSLRARWLALGIRGAELDSLAGIAERYGARLLGPWPIKHMGTDSLGRIMDVLAVKLVLVQDDDMLAVIERRLGRELTGRQMTGGQNNAGGKMLAARRRKRRNKTTFSAKNSMARMCRAAQILKQSGLVRKRIAKIAARARWGRKDAGKVRAVTQGNRT